MGEAESPMSMPMPIPQTGGTPLTPIREQLSASPRSPSSAVSGTSWRRSVHITNSSPASLSRPASTPYSPIVSSQAIPEGWHWDVSPAEMASSDKFFDGLDPFHKGFIEGEVAVGFLSKSKLPTAELGKIWSVDTRKYEIAVRLMPASLQGFIGHGP